MPIFSRAPSRLLTACAAAAFLAACAAQAGSTDTPAMAGHEHVAASTPGAMQAPADAGAPAATEAKAVWVDVRTPAEYQAGHLEGAHNIPVEDIVSQIHTVAPDKNPPVMLYCKSGRRAERARQALTAEGYTHVENRGGYEDLVRQLGAQ